MKLTYLASGAALAMTVAPAFAGNIEEPVFIPAPAPVVMAPSAPITGDWGGFYVGGSLGYADVDEDAGGFVGDGATFGAHAGYDYDFGTFVLGGELEISGFDVSSGGVDVDSVARAKLRAGYDAGAFLPYVTAGVAQLNTGGGLDGSDTGSFYGLGLDYKFTDTIRVGGEVLQHTFDNFDNTGLNLDATTAGVRVAFQF